MLENTLHSPNCNTVFAKIAMPAGKKPHTTSFKNIQQVVNFSYKKQRTNMATLRHTRMTVNRFRQIIANLWIDIEYVLSQIKAIRRIFIVFMIKFSLRCLERIHIYLQKIITLRWCTLSRSKSQNSSNSGIWPSL
jgi:hypothetical protein